MPEQLDLRLIKFAYEDRTGRKRKLIVVTTLVDSKQHDGIELFHLYARRWEIELKLHDVKTTLGFKMIAIKTPAMAHKTLMMIQIACNLLRTLMQRVAEVTGTSSTAMSFIAGDSLGRTDARIIPSLRRATDEKSRASQLSHQIDRCQTHRSPALSKRAESIETKTETFRAAHYASLQIHQDPSSLTLPKNRLSQCHSGPAPFIPKFEVLTSPQTPFIQNLADR